MGGTDPVRAGRHVQLHSLAPDFFPDIHEGLTRTGVADAWRSRGRYIPSSALEAFLTSNVDASFVVTSLENRRPMGLVELIDYQAVERRAQLTAISWANGIAHALVVEALVLAVDEWFARMELRTLHFMFADLDAARFGKSLHALCHYDGRLRNYIVVNGSLSDVLVYSVTPEQFADRLRQRPALMNLSATWRILEARPR